MKYQYLIINDPGVHVVLIWHWRARVNLIPEEKKKGENTNYKGLTMQNATFRWCNNKGKKKSAHMMLLLGLQVNSFNYGLMEAAEVAVFNATGRSVLSAQLK